MKIDKKFTRVFENDNSTETWIYDPSKSARGPISVEIKYKAGAEKAMQQGAKDAKQEKKTARQMKKINNKK